MSSEGSEPLLVEKENPLWTRRKVSKEITSDRSAYRAYAENMEGRALSQKLL